MSKQRRRFEAAEKVKIIREHLLDKQPLSEVCERQAIIAYWHDHPLDGYRRLTYVLTSTLGHPVSKAGRRAVAVRGPSGVVFGASLGLSATGTNYPHGDFDLTWQKLIMYDEHTWRANNSLSQPDSDFAVQ
ncbi:MAG TPA: hypothetical protein ENN97_02325 [Phycisphaerales bacterium]|nr:hypothetical protein [Phycisphaerales bacterium]